MATLMMLSKIAVYIVGLVIGLFFLLTWCGRFKRDEEVIPVSVNYHFSRKCNNSCLFCFHHETTGHVASDEDMKRGLKLLMEAGMKKINFAGGEPFLYPDKLAMLVKFCKEDLQLESVTINSNGTLIKEEWLEQHGKYIDMLGISFDSFDDDTRTKIGRGTDTNSNMLFDLRWLCRHLGIKFKLNTVIMSWNWEEDMTTSVEILDPFRWKVIQVLPVKGENNPSEIEIESNPRTHNVNDLLISNEQFKSFCDKHERLGSFIPISNKLIASSYLILDEHLCFLDKSKSVEKASASILDVGVKKALKKIKWDPKAFALRGGVYHWGRDDVDGCGQYLPNRPHS